MEHDIKLQAVAQQRWQMEDSLTMQQQQIAAYVHTCTTWLWLANTVHPNTRVQARSRVLRNAFVQWQGGSMCQVQSASAGAYHRPAATAQCTLHTASALRILHATQCMNCPCAEYPRASLFGCNVHVHTQHVHNEGYATASSRCTDVTSLLRLC